MLKTYREKFNVLFSEMISEAPYFTLDLYYKTCNQVLALPISSENPVVYDLFSDMLRIIRDECVSRLFALCEKDDK